MRSTASAWSAGGVGPGRCRAGGGRRGDGRAGAAGRERPRGAARRRSGAGRRAGGGRAGEPDLDLARGRRGGVVGEVARLRRVLGRQAGGEQRGDRGGAGAVAVVVEADVAAADGEADRDDLDVGDAGGAQRLAGGGRRRPEAEGG